jgi:hypothetical protein
MRLAPGGANDPFPEPLGEFLNALVAARRGLRGYVLSWDFAMLYALEREWLPIFKLDWRTHRRLSFRLDDQHPVGRVASSEDRGRRRLDCLRQRLRSDDGALGHLPPRERTTRTASISSWQPVSAVPRRRHRRRRRLRSRARRAARERWRRATAPFDRGARGPTPAVRCAWPADVEPALTDIDIAIARTEPAFNGYSAVGEIRQLHLDAIASARRGIFAENQYFHFAARRDAFAQRLREDDAPEIAVISPYTQSGWLGDLDRWACCAAAIIAVARGRPQRAAIASTTRRCRGSTARTAASTSTARCSSSTTSS